MRNTIHSARFKSRALFKIKVSSEVILDTFLLKNFTLYDIVSGNVLI